MILPTYLTDEEAHAIWDCGYCGYDISMHAGANNNGWDGPFQCLFGPGGTTYLARHEVQRRQREKETADTP